MKSALKQVLSIFVAIVILTGNLFLIYSAAATECSVSYVFLGDEAGKAGFA